MATHKTNIWKVFVPSDIFHWPSGFIHGVVQENQSTICVKCIGRAENSEVVGVWVSGGDRAEWTPRGNASVWVHLSTSNPRGESNPWSDANPRGKSNPRSDANPRGISDNRNSSDSRRISCHLLNDKNVKLRLKCHCILFSPSDVLSSFLLTNPPFINESTSTDTRESLTVVVSSLLDLKSGDPCDHYAHSVTPQGIFDPFCQCFLGPVISLFLILGKVLDNSSTNNGYIKMFLDSPALTRQLRHRCSSLRRSIMEKSYSPLARLQFLDACSRQLLDSLLGVAVMIVLVNATLADAAGARVMDWADDVASSLTKLIHWMMGAPAGLKLNSQLTHFLGQFFLYHIYLWTGYLSLLRPVLGMLLKGSSVLGLLGLSAQLSLVQDIVSMMTVHIYCFYVYAARLYSLQVHALASLWRLFRGKKWNVLRHRVDSASYDIDQLFVGTLFFTILLFLLPTTLLYYVFFLTLRLVVLVCEGVLSFCIRVINDAPVFSVIMWAFRSPSVAGDVVFSVVSRSHTGSSLVLTMEPSQVHLGQLLAQVWSAHPAPGVDLPCPESAISKIVKGHLICPWISESSDKMSSL